MLNNIDLSTISEEQARRVYEQIEEKLNKEGDFIMTQEVFLNLLEQNQ